MLMIIAKIADVKIVLVFFLATLLKKFVIKDFFFGLDKLYFY